MDRRAFLAAGALASFERFSLNSATVSQVVADVNQATTNGNARQPVLVRSGFTRTSDGTDELAPSQSGMFDIEVVRSSDSEGRLAIFVFPAGDLSVESTEGLRTWNGPGVLLRIGLVAAAAFFFVLLTLGTSPPLILDQWYAGRAMIALLAPLTLPFWGFYVSLGSQPVFGSAIKEEYGSNQRWGKRN